MMFIIWLLIGFTAGIAASYVAPQLPQTIRYKFLPWVKRKLSSGE